MEQFQESKLGKHSITKLCKLLIIQIFSELVKQVIFFEFVKQLIWKILLRYYPFLKRYCPLNKYNSDSFLDS
jgi:hypothetical protein